MNKQIIQRINNLELNSIDANKRDRVELILVVHRFVERSNHIVARVTCSAMEYCTIKTFLKRSLFIGRSWSLFCKLWDFALKYSDEGTERNVKFTIYQENGKNDGTDDEKMHLITIPKHLNKYTMGKGDKYLLRLPILAIFNNIVLINIQNTSAMQYCILSFFMSAN
eukprot:145528_1